MKVSLKRELVWEKVRYERREILSMTSQQKVKNNTADSSLSSVEDIINNTDNIIKRTVMYFSFREVKTFSVSSHFNPTQSDLMKTVAGAEVRKLRQRGSK